ncbi:MAG: hypothetical protein OXB92_02470 [Acidimicrobiaceae bacterium]|nr:hypothetical protein [Acidimicrobiaceae bacterium]
MDPREVEVIVRTDCAGCTREFLKACRERNVRFCVSHPLTIDIAAAVTEIPDKLWQPAVSSDGSELREHAEITGAWRFRSESVG